MVLLILTRVASHRFVPDKVNRYVKTNKFLIDPASILIT